MSKMTLPATRKYSPLNYAKHNGAIFQQGKRSIFAYIAPRYGGATVCNHGAAFEMACWFNAPGGDVDGGTLIYLGRTPADGWWLQAGGPGGGASKVAALTVYNNFTTYDFASSSTVVTTG